MPKVTWNWEAEYRDPISDAEDRRRQEELERHSAEIMHEIGLYEEHREWELMMEQEWEEEDRLEQERLDEDYLYWRGFQKEFY